MLLRAGEVDLDACAEPTVAREAAYSAVELCGRLPLCLAIAGAMILEHADDWDTWLVPALRDSHGAELRERSAAAMGGADAEGGALSVEERVLRASLRSIKDEERVGVTALFDVCACFAEDVTVPAAVFDALAPAILEEATRTEREIKEGTRKSLDGPWGEKPKPLAKSRSQISDVRRWLREALRHSLLIGSIADGIRMHDLVRDYTLSRAQSRHAGGLRGIQLSVLSALFASRPEGGFIDPTFAAEDRNTAISFYVGQQLHYHLSGAFPAAGDEGANETGEAASLLEDGKLHPSIVAMLEPDEQGDLPTNHKTLLRAIGKERLQSAAEELEANGEWMDAGRAWRASLKMSQGGTPFREASLRGIACFAKVHESGTADDQLASVAREIEARLYMDVQNAVGTGFAWGSDEFKALGERMSHLATKGSILTGKSETVTAAQRCSPSCR